MLERKLVKNKKNGQYTITIPKKAYPFLNKKDPKTVKINLREKDFKF